MKFYTFENRDTDDTGHYNLFEKSVVNTPTTNYNTIIVTDEFKGNLSNLCYYLHGTTKYLEELMVLNNIINPYSIKTNDIIKYFINTDNYGILYQSDIVPNDKKDEILLMNRNKSTKKDTNRIGSVPTIKPDSLKQINVNHSKKTITILNKFK